LISFSGIDGAGKSTQIEQLREYLQNQNYRVRILTFWDNVATFSSLRSGFSRKVLQSDGSVGSPEKPAQRKDKNHRSWPLLAGRFILHLFDLARLRSLIAKLRASRDGEVIIFDRYIYDQLAALPLENCVARAYARWVLKFTPTPDICYLLDAVPEEACARKPEYPLAFMREYRLSYLQLRTLAPLSLISAAGPEDVHAAVVARLNSRMKSFPSAEMDSAAVA
jgi:thymidylate kinase